MSIFIIGASGGITSAPACIIETEVASEMGPAVQNLSEISLGTVDEAVMTVSAACLRPSSRHVQTLVSSKEAKTSHTIYHGYASCYGLPYQDHNYGAPPPRTPPPPSPKLEEQVDEDTSLSLLSTTSTNNEEEAPLPTNPPQSTDSITRCICGFNHDDEYMICCDKCFVWQHVDCMGLDRTNMPETYLCECCQPRKVDKQKAKALQTRKKEEMTADSSSDETGDDVPRIGINGHPLMIKGGKIKKRRKDKIAERQHIKKTLRRLKKEKDGKKPKGRRRTKSRSENSNALDEESQDAWDCSLREWNDKYEKAVFNQYAPEVQILMGSLKLNGQNDEYVRKTLELLEGKLYCVGQVDEGEGVRGLLATQDISSDQAIVEFCGKFLPLSQFKEHNPVFNKRNQPFVLFHKALPNGEQVCVDAREYGNDARFVRRSCNPNAVVRHLVQNGTLHLYLFSSCKISKGQEITIPFDHPHDCIGDCACNKESCPVTPPPRRNSVKDCSEKKRKGKRQSVEDENSQQASQNITLPTSPVKAIKNSPIKQEILDGDDFEISSTVNSEVAGESVEASESEKQLAERQKKMTREERKIDAYMRAFERMEKMAKKRQQNQEKLAHMKASHPSDQGSIPDQSGDRGEELTSQSQVPCTPAPVVNTCATATVDVMPSELALPPDQEVSPTALLASPTRDDNRPTTLTANSLLQKHKKGKRKRRSSSVVKRRVRTSSGGSDLLSPEECSYSVPPLLMCSQQQQVTVLTSGPSLLSHQNSNSCSSPFSAPSPTLLVGAPSPAQGDVTTVLASPTGMHPGGIECIFPKSKRFLMHEWMQEKAESAVPISNPLSVRTELCCTPPTCYVRCTRDAPNYGGISASLLRRNSTSGGSRPAPAAPNQGSAKKRWLRQALTDDKGPDGLPGEDLDPEHSYPGEGGCCISPGPQGDTSNPSPPDDLVTPLKKRRLMRESLDSSPGMMSPRNLDRPGSSISWTEGSPEHSSTFGGPHPPPIIHMRSLDEASTDSVDIENSLAATGPPSVEAVTVEEGVGGGAPVGEVKTVESLVVEEVVLQTRTDHTVPEDSAIEAPPPKSLVVEPTGLGPEDVVRNNEDVCKTEFFSQTLVPGRSADQQGVNSKAEHFEKAEKTESISSSLCGDGEFRTTPCKDVPSDVLLVTSSSVLLCGSPTQKTAKVLPEGNVPCSQVLKVDVPAPPPQPQTCSGDDDDDAQQAVQQPHELSSAPDSSGQRATNESLVTAGTELGREEDEEEEAGEVVEDEPASESTNPGEAVHELSPPRPLSPDTTKYFVAEMGSAVMAGPAECCLEDQVTSSTPDCCAPASPVHSGDCNTPSDSSLAVSPLSDVSSVYFLGSPSKFCVQQPGSGSNGSSSVVSSSTPGGHKRKVSLFEYRLRMRDTVSNNTKASSSSSGSKGNTPLLSPQKEKSPSPPDKWTLIQMGPSSPGPAPPPPPPRPQPNNMTTPPAHDKLLNNSPVKAAIELVRGKRDWSEEKTADREGEEMDAITGKGMDAVGFPIPVAFSKNVPGQNYITQITVASYSCRGTRPPPPPPPQGQPIPVLCSRTPTTPPHLLSLLGPRTVVPFSATSQPSSHFAHHSPGGSIEGSSPPPPPPPPPLPNQHSPSISASPFGQSFVANSNYVGLGSQMTYKETRKNQA